MSVKIDSRFATAREIADVLGVSEKRVRELAKLVDSSKTARRAGGISWTAPAKSRDASSLALKLKRARTFELSDSHHFKPSKKSKAIKRNQKRGKKSKTRL
jgi:hypothetical protein